ncbi:MAG TPA: ornithine cyclodeaminase family protein [Synergistales bacterium]|nr:ornithine cyclodeaminase family protein [Synergistales bacterium]HRV71615.1 ornithine cyclodeaminase family protein [Thermovirgaceae bacterium]
MEIMLLSLREIESLNIHVSEVMKVVERGFALKGEEKMEMPAKIGIHPRKDCFIHAMPCYVGGDVDAAGIKWVAGYPINQARGLPYITGIMCLNESETGFAKAIMDANWITAWRTGAATGICARHMADPSSETIAVIGLGVQGRTNTMALAEALPKLKTVKIYDAFEAQVAKYTSLVEPDLKGIDVVPCKSVEETVKDADVVVTCTPIVADPERFVKSKWLKEDVLAVAVDYDSAFDADVMTGATAFVCDDMNQYLWTQEHGVYFQKGYPTESQILGDMGHLCAGKKKVERKGRRGAVLMGIASHDIMTANLIFDQAKARGVGRMVEI